MNVSVTVPKFKRFDEATKSANHKMKPSSQKQKRYQATRNLRLKQFRQLQESLLDESLKWNPAKRHREVQSQAHNRPFLVSFYDDGDVPAFNKLGLIPVFRCTRT
jgi:hypothetical protein